MSRLTAVLDTTKINASVILVDDGSSDSTAQLMRKQSESDDRFTSVFLSRNFGHQLALTAGLAHVDASEGAFILDGDLQDPPELLDAFYNKLKEGNDVVYAVRKNRKEGFFKKMLYKSFYLLLKKISYLKIPLDSGDFSMVSRRVVDHMNDMQEESRFLRGMRSWIGFNQVGLEYERDERQAGDSKYTLKNLFQLAFNGIFNFSEFPVKFITRLGLWTVFLSFLFLLWTLYVRIFLGEVPEGFTSLLIAIVMFGGVQLISIGILGEYILRIFFQVKKRPLFIVKEVINDNKAVKDSE